MTIRLIGAGLGRTGTMSLKLALEQLLGGTCHHMMEVWGHPDEVPVWNVAMHDRPVDWHALLDGYSAIVDYPGAAVWRELADAFPDAPVLLSTRSSAQAWYDSASATIFQTSEWEATDDAGRRVGTVVRCARSAGARRAVPAHEHPRRVPRPSRHGRLTTTIIGS